METIDKDRAVELLAAAVEEYGTEHTLNGSCVYVMVDQPYCMVAVALSKAGFSVEQLRGGDYANGRNIGARDDLISCMTPNAVKVFTTAQDAQDIAHPWGYALERASKRAERLKVP